MKQVLIVDDDRLSREALQHLLESHGYTVILAVTVDEALARTREGAPQLVLGNERLPGTPGTELIDLMNPVPVVIMTRHASLRAAVETMKLGAADYLTKPLDHGELIQLVKRLLGKAPRPASGEAAQEAKAHDGFGIMAGRSRPMRELFERIGKVARTDATVLIQGESGTGKELAARALHQQSTRAGEPMISVNCAAIPHSLIESELFGHEKGAFTGAVKTHRGLIEAADGGSLFLDEIGELPLEAQARLLRVLQEGEIRRVGSVEAMQVDIRLIAATHRDLKALTRAGRFREDLFYRLYIMEIRMPPLRERGEDIGELAAHFLREACERLGTPQRRLTVAAKEALQRHTWPGNVRELENTIERAAILCEEATISAELLGLDPGEASSDSASSLNRAAKDSVASPSQDLSLMDYFKGFVLAHQDELTETEIARRLGISRKTLWKRRRKLGIPRRSQL